ncbi:late embryogenesis abundant protein At5g17165-like [Rutidosis leptorrhynchoides]|uniref:late embryogenesis abundant protein At5g17165-like n=1 Tax=Rutidosis leptorrhynchoides TaxID=125765 RepID=UPI003A98CED1
MAANSQSRSIASLGKRFVNQIRTSSAVDSNLILRRAVHVSVYDKNVDEQVRPTLVPEEPLTRAVSETDWIPHPKTGVFGPADGQKLAVSEPKATIGSVLEEKAFYRPLENLEKPAHP